MSNKNKETKIQRCQNVLATIEQVKNGLVCMQPEVVPENFELDHLFIECDPWDYEDRVQGIKDTHLQSELEYAHNRYVAVLAEMKKRKGEELTKLLQTDAN